MFIKGMNAVYGPERGAGSGGGESSTADQINQLIDDNDADLFGSGDDDADGGEDTVSTTDQTQRTNTQQGTDADARDQQQQTTGRRDQRNDQTQRGQKQERADTRPPQPGDLVHPTTGQVLARAGHERRVYEKAVANLKPQFERVQGAARQIQEQLRTTTAELNGLKQSQQALQQIGLSAPELTQAAQLWHALKSKPLEAVKAIVARAKAAGHNIEGVGGSDINMSALDTMITNKLKPILDEHGARQEDANARQGAAQATRAFFNAYPDAVTHENSIAAVMAQDATLTPREAYLQVRLYATTHGLDWSKPLPPQIMARRQGGGQQQQQQQNGQRQRVNGRAQFADTMDDTGAAQQADIDESWDNIVRREMKAAGLKVR